MEVRDWMLYYDRQEIEFLKRSDATRRELGIYDDNRTTISHLVIVEEFLEEEARQHGESK